MNSVLFAQTSSTDEAVGALVRRLVRGGLGIAPGSAVELLLILMGWLILLALVALLVQRDWQKWLRGLADIRGHLEQLGAGLEILRRNKRPLWVLLAAAVLSWTGWALLVWDDPTSRDELEGMLALHENSAWSFASAHALAAAIVPWRDLSGLGDLLPLVGGACLILFARTARLAQDLRSRTRVVENVRLKRRLGTVWVSLIILTAYRGLITLIAPQSTPMADCMYLNAIMFPLLLLVADALLLSWVLSEFGRSLLGHFDWQPEDTLVFVRSIPFAALTCALLNPARYVLVACAIWQAQFASQTWPAARWMSILWYCSVGQVMALTWFAVPAILVVHRVGGVGAKFFAFVELIRRVGGQVVGLTIVSILFCFVAVIPFYWIFSTMQNETWSLLGAASYGHYATLLVGLICLAGVTQLAYRELGMVEDRGPRATLLPEPARFEAATTSGIVNPIPSS